VTDDKKFKRLVRDKARETGTNYTTAREQLRPGDEVRGQSPGPSGAIDVFAEGFALIEQAVRARFFGDESLVRLVAVAAVGGASVICTDPPGTGHTALAQSVAAATGANVVCVNGDPDVTGADLPEVGPSDVLLVNAIDHLPLRTQRAVLAAAHQCVTVLAKRHPLVDRVPHPLNHEILDRFALGISLGSPPADQLLDIIAANRGDVVIEEREGIAFDELTAMRGLLNQVAFPDGVRRQLADAFSTIRQQAAVGSGAQVTAMLQLVGLAPIVAASAARAAVTFDDIAWLLPHVLRHRLVIDDGADVDELVRSAIAGSAS
jgi:MoxR-like ATPase